MITGKTIIKREVVDKPGSDNVLRIIPANTVIVATENKLQWLQLIDGGWVNAGPDQRYIQWQITSTIPDIGPLPDNINSSGNIIKGLTIIKREVVDKPESENILRTIAANTVIYAKENKLQWLHLVDGGWVNAGPQQKYIKWEIVKETTTPPPPPNTDPRPIPGKTRQITEIKRRGRIASLRVDWQNPKWNYSPRPIPNVASYPQTVTFNSTMNRSKGPRLPLTAGVLNYLGQLNPEHIKEKILVPSTGWLNIITVPPTTERLTWAANVVVVLEIRTAESGLKYANVFGENCHASELDGSFFEKDMRLIVHKFNACTKNKAMIKLGSGYDCYTPFTTDTNTENGDMLIPVDWIELWPELPFRLNDGTDIIEYELYGLNTFGIRGDGSAVLLRDPKGFKTNWQIETPELPA